MRNTPSDGSLRWSRCSERLVHTDALGDTFSCSLLATPLDVSNPRHENEPFFGYHGSWLQFHTPFAQPARVNSMITSV
jgi:hypothetical protein